VGMGTSVGQEVDGGEISVRGGLEEGVGREIAPRTEGMQTHRRSCIEKQRAPRNKRPPRSVKKRRYSICNGRLEQIPVMAEGRRRVSVKATNMTCKFKQQNQ